MSISSPACGDTEGPVAMVGLLTLRMYAKSSLPGPVCVVAAHQETWGHDDIPHCKQLQKSAGKDLG